MKMIQKITALVIALLVMCSAAQAEWRAAGGNNKRFLDLLDLLGESVAEGKEQDTAAIDAVLKEIRQKSVDDYDVAMAIVDHWNHNVVNPTYRMFAWRGDDRAYPLERSGLDFSGKHAFVVLGYKLKNGEMEEELIGRCDAAAAAAVSFPDAILVTTGGATGENNPLRHTEAGEMKDYLVEHYGIDPGRIFTETKAKSTLENALNTFGILKKQKVESYTIITSDYHQRWAQILFNARAAMFEKDTGYKIRLVGNFNYLAPNGKHTSVRIGLSQLSTLFGKR